ncbi:MAG: MotA/TolQ/ExbB proton channel family protein [Betaproteobacteria bacterium]|nr:MotA/TolQ/ExbB proton channel family protein [Betaproteobacteria bacterium]
MSLNHIVDLANDSGGTLYLMIILFTLALTIIIERSRHLSNMIEAGDSLLKLVKTKNNQNGQAFSEFLEKHPKLPHLNLIHAANELPINIRHDRESLDSVLEEALMHEVPKLDRSLWMLDTVITLAPLLGLFGTILGMFNAFSVLGQGQSGALQITSGIAEALLATASGLVVAMIGLIFFNGLNSRVRLVIHQLETLKIIILNQGDIKIQHNLKAL